MVTLLYNLHSEISGIKPRQELVETTSLDRTAELLVSTEVLKADNVFSDSQERASQSILTITQYPSLDARDWNRAAQKRFHDLAVKEALGTISDPEARELEHLQALRRLAEVQVNAEQILFEIQRQQALAEIKETLERYSDVFRRFAS